MTEADGGGAGRWAIAYARVSTDDQVRGYSIRQQLEAIRAWCAREGYEVLEEIVDDGHSAAYLERPGLDRARDLVRAAQPAVAVVIAQDADRITREPMHRFVLDEEMERSGTRLLALDDWGDDSHEGELLKFLKGWVSKGERLKIAERMRRGLDRKVREGKVIRGNQAPYGFRYSEDGEALVVSEPEMSNLRRIFRMSVAGASLGEIQRVFQREGIPSAMGGGWPRSTIRHLLLSELYLPRRPRELEGLVPDGLLAGLDPAREYGLWIWNRRKQTRWRERDLDGVIRNRVENKERPRDQWSAIPVDLSGSGLVEMKPLVEAAREKSSGNALRPPSRRVKHFWQLSGGIARCEVCGNGYSPHTVHERVNGRLTGKIRTYYRCYSRYNYGLDFCANRRNMNAAALEEGVWEVVYGLISNPHRMLRQYEEHQQRQQAEMRSDPEKQAGEITARLEKLERRRDGYLEMRADGDLSREELREKLAGLDAHREGLEKSLQEAETKRRSVQAAQVNWAHLNSLLLQMKSTDLATASPQDRRRLYAALRLRASVDQDRTVRVRGVFDPDVYLPGILRDPPDVTTPRVREPKYVVTLDSTRRCTS